MNQPKKRNCLKEIVDVIKEKNIVIFAPHYDDSILITGNYFLEMKEKNLLSSKTFEFVLLFARSNYLAGTGPGNFDISLDRQKLATGKRLIEDLECLDEIFGEGRYVYRVCGEKECFVRQKEFADSEMEFPHGMYEGFDDKDWAILNRLEDKVREYAQNEDTALVFPIAFKEHIDHFITREAGIRVAKELGERAKAKFYFQEDKPYAGIASLEEKSRIETFVKENSLEKLVYKAHPEKLIELTFRHYISQVEEVYRVGIQSRCNDLKSEVALDDFCDQMFKYSRD